MKLTDIYQCERAEGQHRGRWIIQTYHPTGMPYADELCPHYPSREAAREAVRQAAYALSLYRA